MISSCLLSKSSATCDEIDTRSCHDRRKNGMEAYQLFLVPKNSNLTSSHMKVMMLSMLSTMSGLHAANLAFPRSNNKLWMLSQHFFCIVERFMVNSKSNRKGDVQGNIVATVQTSNCVEHLTNYHLLGRLVKTSGFFLSSRCCPALFASLFRG